eukprot:Protomagalhaensia_sp_Gyna_25__570@NODE_1269_length_1995_cov_5_063395_g1011_i0_p3_GENE_NODE_1269_length_1995_cov_5_063395_g1011_i0NODE_1269_length_1995_cov_5_063395_g1011_i0_p3_ORF_typecomplete_len121_score6_78_NODE_1269_length_1995_cov_5_063395_g1011_i0154516
MQQPKASPVPGIQTGTPVTPASARSPRSPGAAARYRGGVRRAAAERQQENLGLPLNRVREYRQSNQLASIVRFSLSIRVTSDHEKNKPLTQRVTDNGNAICLCPSMHDCQRAVRNLVAAF